MPQNILRRAKHEIPHHSMEITRQDHIAIVEMSNSFAHHTHKSQNRFSVGCARVDCAEHRQQGGKTIGKYTFWPLIAN